MLSYRDDVHHLSQVSEYVAPSVFVLDHMTQSGRNPGMTSEAAVDNVPCALGS